MTKNGQMYSQSLRFDTKKLLINDFNILRQQRYTVFRIVFYCMLMLNILN